MSAPKPPQDDEQPPDLTPEDAALLDKAWESVTDEDIEESVRWLDETDDEATPPAPPAPRKPVVIDVDADPHNANWIRILEQRRRRQETSGE